LAEWEWPIPVAQSVPVGNPAERCVRADCWDVPEMVVVQERESAVLKASKNPSRVGLWAAVQERVVATVNETKAVLVQEWVAALPSNPVPVSRWVCRAATFQGTCSAKRVCRWVAETVPVARCRLVSSMGFPVWREQAWFSRRLAGSV
jgi:hypothetical protein